MVSRIAKSICVFGIGLSLALTGCMVSPAQQSIVKTKTEKVLFEGFTDKPNQEVTIFAKRASDLKWIKLGTANTSAKSLAGTFGGSWYGWNTKLLIPSTCWQYSGLFLPVAEVKAVVDGESLATFDEGFYGYVGEYDSLVELYQDHGHQTSAFVFAEQ